MASIGKSCAETTAAHPFDEALTTASASSSSTDLEAAAVSSSSNQEKQPDQPTICLYKIIICLCLCSFVDSVNTINFASVLPAVADQFSATTGQAFWCGTVLLFAQCIAQPVCGALAESLGRKLIIMMALAIFSLGSLLTAVAQSITWMILARALQGLGGGGMNVCVNLIVVDVATPSDRPKWNGLIALSAAVGLVAGVLSGSASTNVTWRIIFYANLPIAILPMIMIAIFLPSNKNNSKGRTNLKSMDWTGIVIFSGSVASILFAIISGGSQYPWASYHILVPLVVGIAGLLGFILFEHFLAGKHGFGAAFIPLSLFRDYTAAFGYLISFIQAAALWAVSYYIQLYLHISDSKSLLEAAVLVLPGTLMTPVSAATAGILMSKFNHFKYFNLAACVLLTASFCGFCTLRTNPNIAQLVGFQILFGVGGGILFPGRLVAVQTAHRPKDEMNDNLGQVRVATSLVSLTTSLGQAFGIAMGSTALQSAWDTLVANAVHDGKISGPYILPGSAAARSATLIAGFPTQVAELYREIAALSIARIWYICIGLCGLAVLAAAVSRNRPLKLKGK